VERSYRTFVNDKDRPTLIIVHSHIGYGAPHMHDTPSAHGEPLGAEEVRLTKEFFAFDPDQTFVVPEGVRAHFDSNFETRGAGMCKAWNAAFARYRAQYPDLGDQIERLQKRDLPDGWDAGTDLRPECHRHVDAGCVEQDPERCGRAGAMAGGWRG
jgi:transketolase